MTKQEKETDAYLRKENKALREELQAKDAQLREAEANLMGLYIAAALKFGTNISLTQTEMVLNRRYIFDRKLHDMYAVYIEDRVDKAERVVQVRRV